MNKFAHLLLLGSIRLLKAKTVLRLVDSLINFLKPSFLYQKLGFHNFEPIMMSMSMIKSCSYFAPTLFSTLYFYKHQILFT